LARKLLLKKRPISGTLGEGGEKMSGILYLAESDKREAWKKYRPILEDMNERQLRQALILILDGTDIEKVFDVAMTLK
jgi:hypothetical protein